MKIHQWARWAPVFATALTAWGMCRPAAALAAGITWPANQVLPSFTAPAATLDVMDLTTAREDEAALFTSLKGLVNRSQPRIFTYDSAVRGQDGKYGWLNSLGLGYTDVADNWSLLSKYRSEVAGIVVYDTAVPDTMNLATTLAGLRDGVVASPELVARLTSAPYNLPILMDLRGRFTTKLQVYQYLYDNHWSQVTHRVIIGLAPDIKGFLRDLGAQMTMRPRCWRL